MKKQPARIASSVRASTTLAIDAMYKEMKANGIDVVGFGAGEPDFPTPKNISDAGHAAIDNNITKYTPAAGLEALKKAAAARMKADCGVEYAPAQVVVSSGAKHNVYIALMSLVDPGDEVILPAPYWISYYEMIRMAGGTPVIVEASEAQDFKITASMLEAAMTEKTKAMILCNPSNPTGMMYTGEELAAIAEVCVRHGIYVIADEIYYKLVYDNAQFVSFASLGEEVRERTIVVSGVSKSYSMTGWRIGYTFSNPQLAKIMGNYQSHSTSAPSSISQMAAIEALNGSQDSIEDMRRAFEERRNYIVERMNTIPGVSCRRPQGAFYVMMNIDSLIGKTLYGTVIENDDVFAKLLLEKGLVAVVPCAGFGSPNFLRWSYATSMENIKEGLDRLERFLANG